MKNDIILFLKLFHIKFDYHDLFGKAAEISYYLLFSLFPIILLLISLLPFFQIDTDAFVAYSQLVVPSAVTQIVKELITYLLSEPNSYALSVGILFTIYSASGATSAVLKNLNRIYNGRLTRSHFKYKIISLLLTVSLILFLIIYMSIYTLTSEFVIQFFSQYWVDIFMMFKFIFLPLFFIILISCFYYIAPKTYHFKYQIIPGTLFFLITYQLFTNFYTIYLTNFSNYQLKYGSISFIIVILLWMFSTSLFLLMGGLLNATIMDFRKLKNLDSLTQTDDFDHAYATLLLEYEQNTTNQK